MTKKIMYISLLLLFFGLAIWPAVQQTEQGNKLVFNHPMSAQAQIGFTQAYTVFLPIVYSNPTPTSTPTPLPTATSTPVPPNMVITDIFYDGVVPRVESDEYIEIQNQGGTVADLTGWHINAGDVGQDYYFQDGFTMQPGQICRVYTNEIHSASCGLSFGSGNALWKNGGDTGYLYNAQGAVVSQRSY